MEAESTKAQEESQQIDGQEQEGALGDAHSPSEGRAREAPGEGGKAEASGKEVLGESQAGKTESAGSEAPKESEAGGGEAARKEAKVVNEPTRDPSGNEAVQECEPGGKEKDVSEGSQTEAGDRVALGVSGMEPKDEADVSGTPEEPREGEEGKADALERNTSISSREGRTGSTSDEPLSPEQEEEEEFWPEFSPSSPDESPQSPTSLKSLETGDATSSPCSPEAAAGDTTSLSTGAAPEGNQKQPSSPPEGEAESKEKKKRPTFDRRELTRPRMPPRAQSRKAIVEKFGGVASGPAPNIKKTGGANTVKTMLLEWCRAKTRGYEHVDIQNFSSSWSSGMAFCALIHKFFPDAFDYAALDPANRRENFALAFSTAEKLADCAQLLDVDDMVRMSVPDNKCIYTYIQELYRSLVGKGLVKTKKK
ncbi:smoothelin-like protein 1 [Pogona vitticeps]